MTFAELISKYGQGAISFPQHLAETVAHAETEVKIINVATTGNDTHNGSSSSPYKTITHALSTVKKNLLASVKIRVFPGDYTSEGNIAVQGFSGHDLIITAFDGTNDVTSHSESYKVEGFTFYDTKVAYLQGFHLVHTTGNSYANFASNTILRIIGCSTTATGDLQSAFGCTEGSYIAISGCKAANQNTVISANHGSIVYCETWDSGSTGNTNCFVTNRGAKVVKGDDTLPGYTYLEITTLLGGQLWDKNGVQIITDDIDKNKKAFSGLFSKDISLNENIEIDISLASKPSWIKIVAGVQGGVARSEGFWTEKGDGSCISILSDNTVSPGYSEISLNLGSGNSVLYDISSVTSTKITLARTASGSPTGTMYASVLCGI